MDDYYIIRYQYSMPWDRSQYYLIGSPSTKAFSSIDEAIAWAVKERMTGNKIAIAIDWFPNMTKPGGRQNYFCRVLNFKDQE